MFPTWVTTLLSKARRLSALWSYSLEWEKAVPENIGVKPQLCQMCEEAAVLKGLISTGRLGPASRRKWL